MRDLIGFKSHCIIKAGDEIFNFHFGYKMNTDGLFEITIDERPDGPFFKSIHILKEILKENGVNVVCVEEENKKLCDTDKGAMKIAGWWAIRLSRSIFFNEDFNEKLGNDEHKVKIIRHKRLFQGSVPA